MHGERVGNGVVGMVWLYWCMMAWWVGSLVGWWVDHSTSPKYEKGGQSRTAYQPFKKVPVVKSGEEMRNFRLEF